LARGCFSRYPGGSGWARIFLSVSQWRWYSRHASPLAELAGPVPACGTSTQISISVNTPASCRPAGGSRAWIPTVGRGEQERHGIRIGSRRVTPLTRQNRAPMPSSAPAPAFGQRLQTTGPCPKMDEPLDRARTPTAARSSVRERVRVSRAHRRCFTRTRHLLVLPLLGSLTESGRGSSSSYGRQSRFWDASERGRP